MAWTEVFKSEVQPLAHSKLLIPRNAPRPSIPDRRIFAPAEMVQEVNYNLVSFSLRDDSLNGNSRVH